MLLFSETSTVTYIMFPLKDKEMQGILRHYFRDVD